MKLDPKLAAALSAMAFVAIGVLVGRAIGGGQEQAMTAMPMSAGTTMTQPMMGAMAPGMVPMFGAGKMGMNGMGAPVVMQGMVFVPGVTDLGMPNAGIMPMDIGGGRGAMMVPMGFTAPQWGVVMVPTGMGGDMQAVMMIPVEMGEDSRGMMMVPTLMGESMGVPSMWRFGMIGVPWMSMGSMPAGMAVQPPAGMAEGERVGGVDRRVAPEGGAPGLGMMEDAAAASGTGPAAGEATSMEMEGARPLGPPTTGGRAR
jgi:hypothetical protein